MILRFCCVFLVGTIGLYGGRVDAVIPHWPQSGWIWADEWRADLSGIRIFQREVSAPSTPAAMARVLTVRLPQFNRLVIIDGQILLSGLSGSHHWLARIGHDDSGARAMISAMAVQEIDAAPSGFDPSSFALAQARLKSSHTHMQDGHRITQLLFESDQELPALSRRVARILSDAGWRIRDRDDFVGAHSRLWVRARDSVHVRMHERESGSVLWVSHHGAPQ